MLYRIHNEHLSMTVSSTGAEPQDLQAGPSHDLGCIWDGGPAWPRRAPVCFPWCGRVEDGYFEEAGRRYQAGVHGFVRDQVHTLVDRGDQWLHFSLDWAADEVVWPWHFSFETEHRLEGPTLVTTLTAKNLDEKPMPAQMGFHTALRCPFHSGTAPEDYRFRFQLPEAPDGTHLFPITTPMFDRDSLQFHGLQSAWVQVEEKATGRFLRVDTVGFTDVLLWSAPGVPGFVCIEPWTGYPGGGHSLWARPDCVTLEPGETLRRTQVLTLG